MTKAVRRNTVSDHDLLSWLFSAEVEHSCSRARLIELRTAHKDEFTDWHKAKIAGAASALK